jgi:hypothetical protein
LTTTVSPRRLLETAPLREKGRLKVMIAGVAKIVTESRVAAPQAEATAIPAQTTASARMRFRALRSATLAQTPETVRGPFLWIPLKNFGVNSDRFMLTL